MRSGRWSSLVMLTTAERTPRGSSTRIGETLNSAARAGAASASAMRRRIRSMPHFRRHAPDDWQAMQSYCQAMQIHRASFAAGLASTTLRWAAW